MMLIDICIGHNLSYTDQNIDMSLCLRSYCDAVNAYIFKYFLFLVIKIHG